MNFLSGLGTNPVLRVPVLKGSNGSHWLHGSGSPGSGSISISVPAVLILLMAPVPLVPNGAPELGPLKYF